jgi:hypothetical protein
MWDFPIFYTNAYTFFQRIEFETCARCRRGTDKGKTYGCVRWWLLGRFDLVETDGDIEDFSEKPGVGFREAAGAAEEALSKWPPTIGL